MLLNKVSLKFKMQIHLVAAFLDVKPGCVSIPVQVQAEKPCTLLL
jgi:hypothetical protein